MSSAEVASTSSAFEAPVKPVVQPTPLPPPPPARPVILDAIRSSEDDGQALEGIKGIFNTHRGKIGFALGAASTVFILA